MRKPLDWDDDDENEQHHAHRDKAHFQAYQRADGKWNLAFRDDLSLPFVQGISIEFGDGTPDILLNEDDDVEYAVPG